MKLLIIAALLTLSGAAMAGTTSSLLCTYAILAPNAINELNTKITELKNVQVSAPSFAVQNDHTYACVTVTTTTPDQPPAASSTPAKK